MSRASSAASGAHRSHVIAAFAALYTIWGSTYLAIHYAVETIPPFLMGGTRFVIAGLILYLLARQRGAVAPTRPQWRAATITGILLLVGGNGAVIWSEQHVASGLVALIVAIVPLWMVALDWLRPGGTRPGPAVFLGLALGLIGLLLLIGPDAIAPRGGSRIDVRAALVPVVGSMLWALGSIFGRYAPRPSSAQLTTGMQMLAGGAAFLVVSLLAGEPRHFSLAAVTAPSWMGYLYLLTFGSLLGFTAYIYLLGATTPAKASTYAYVNPVVAVILGWAVVGEPLTPRMLAAAAIILGAVALITLANAKQTAQAPVSAARNEHDGLARRAAAAGGERVA
ncbi:MAG TPA: EamA family transporter [Gemmatimonadaceae bacterium]|nr:EamA family transporter [Gemmatimonadaceae bacterium]